MDEPVPRLQPGEPKGSGQRLPRIGGVIVLVVALAFLSGLGVGVRIARAPAPRASETALPAFQGVHVSRALWTAYLNVAKSGWALCSVGAEITCQALAAVPDPLFARFESLPLSVSLHDWVLLSPIAVPPGHYVLAGPMTLLAPEVTFAQVSEGGVGTLVGPDDQATWNAVEWADLGSLDLGRYVAVVGAYDLSGSDSRGHTTAERIGWGLGFVVSALP